MVDRRNRLIIVYVTYYTLGWLVVKLAADRIRTGFCQHNIALTQLNSTENYGRR